MVQLSAQVVAIGRCDFRDSRAQNKLNKVIRAFCGGENRQITGLQVSNTVHDLVKICFKIERNIN